jgi:hypothetical protein
MPGALDSARVFADRIDNPAVLQRLAPLTSQSRSAVASGLAR